MTIPKKIHYVWVGGGEKPETIKKCMNTWKKHLGEYEIIEWNENNFDIEAHPFAKEAYKRKKWAFVSDYIRAYVIHEQGGIYLDTDVIVLDDLKKYLNHRAFVGFENQKYPFTAVFGAEKGHPFLKDMLQLYDGKSFTFDVKDQMAEVNTKTVSDILIEKYQCQVTNTYQVLKEGIAVYPDDVLCNPSENSSSIHVFTGTWMEGAKPAWVRINKFLKVRLTTKKRAAIYNKWIRRGRC